jgi:hypothetical protein
LAAVFQAVKRAERSQYFAGVAAELASMTPERTSAARAESLSLTIVWLSLGVIVSAETASRIFW